MNKVDFIIWLKKEVENWKTEGIINESQALKILSRYDIVDKKEDSHKLTIVVSILGAVLIGIGAILFVASNWDKIPDSLKLIILFGTTFITYYIGWKLKYDTKSHTKTGHALLFLASIFVGATIFLTAQIFNVNANAHWLVFLWFLAILPFGYAFSSKYILGLNIFTFALWMTLYTISVIEDIFETFMLYLLFGICLYGVGQLHSIYQNAKKYSHFTLTYQGVGLFFILISYFYFSLETPYIHYFREFNTNEWGIQLLFVLFGISALISILGSAIRNKKNLKYEFYLLLLAFLGWIGIWLLTFFKEALTITTTTRYGYTTSDPFADLILFIIFNLVFFIISIGSILIGYYKAVIPFINIGILFFVLGILHLYFTTIYELLPRSFAFIIGGLILLVGGWYLEKKRKMLIRDIEAFKNE